jgi:AcrR family transcriptional regulator
MSERATPGRDGGRNTRRRLLAAADKLFYAGGICATGVNAVAERAGVTKMTLYAHFPSKDELVAAYLEDHHRRWREFLEETLAGHDDPREKLLAVCDAYQGWLTAGDLRGCAFVNCAAEFPDPDHPARRVVREHKAGVRERLKTLAAEAGAEDPDVLAERVFVVLEGAYVTGALEGDEGVLRRARDLVAELVGVATGTSPTANG